MQVAVQEAAIKERAYAIWEAEGRPQGRDWDHWYRALHELAAPAPTRTRAAIRAAPPKAKAPKTVKGRLREALKSALS